MKDNSPSTRAELDQRWACLRDFIGGLTPDEQKEIRRVLADVDCVSFVQLMGDSALQYIMRELALAALDEAERRRLDLVLTSCSTP